MSDDTTPAETPAGTKGRAARLKAGEVVTYRHPDPIITGAQLEGAGVIVEAGSAGGYLIAPLSPSFLLVDPENVNPVSAATVGGA